MSWTKIINDYYSKPAPNTLSKEETLIQSIPVQKIAYDTLIEAKNIEACVLYVRKIHILVTKSDEDYYSIKATAFIEPTDKEDRVMPTFKKTMWVDSFFGEDGLEEKITNAVRTAIISAKQFGFNISRLSENDIGTAFFEEEDDSF